MDSSGKAFWLSLTAITISLFSALFSGLQWNESRRSRQDQENVAVKSRELLVAQTMEAERANMNAQRRLNPRLAKDQSDLPKMTASRGLMGTLLPLPFLGRGNEKPYDIVDDFLSTKAKTIIVTNEGGSTAYDVVAKNWSSIAEKRQGGIFPRKLPEDHQTVLASGVSIAIPGDEANINADDLEAFRQGEAGYYISGGVQYRDAFHEIHSGIWCYEFTVKKSFRNRDLEERLCDLPGSKLGPRIEKDKPNDDR